MAIGFDNPRTVDGRPVRILCVDRKPGGIGLSEDRPIIALVPDPICGGEMVVSYHADGGGVCAGYELVHRPDATSVLDAKACEAARLAWLKGCPSPDGALRPGAMCFGSPLAMPDWTLELPVASGHWDGHRYVK